MSEENNQGRHPSHFRTIDSISRSYYKPEGTRYTQFTDNALRDYAQGLFYQPSPPEVIQQFIDHHGVLIPIGSLAKGAMNPESDVDVLKVYSSPDPYNFVYRQIIGGENPGHPSGLSFVKFFERQLERKHPDLYIQRQAASIIENEEPSPQDLAAAWEQGSPPKKPQQGDRFIAVHDESTLSVNTHNIAVGLESISSLDERRWENFFMNKKSSPVIGIYGNYMALKRDLYFMPALLISTQTSAMQSRPDALFTLQKEIAAGLVHVANTQPARYEHLERGLRGDMYTLVMGDPQRDKEKAARYEAMIGNYAESSDDKREHIHANPERAKQLLLTLRKELALSFPSVDELRRKFLSEDK